MSWKGASASTWLRLVSLHIGVVGAVVSEQAAAKACVVAWPSKTGHREMRAVAAPAARDVCKRVVLVVPWLRPEV